MLGEIIMEICFDCHWSMKTGLSSNLTKAQQIAAKDALGNRGKINQWDVDVDESSIDVHMCNSRYFCFV